MNNLLAGTHGLVEQYVNDFIKLESFYKILGFFYSIVIFPLPNHVFNENTFNLKNKEFKSTLVWNFFCLILLFQNLKIDLYFIIC